MEINTLTDEDLRLKYYRQGSNNTLIWKKRRGEMRGERRKLLANNLFFFLLEAKCYSLCLPLILSVIIFFPLAFLNIDFSFLHLTSNRIVQDRCLYIHRVNRN